MKLYLLQVGSWFKIGITNDEARRLFAYRTESPLALDVLGVWELPDAYDQEQILLRRYRRRLVKGKEWLALRPRDVYRIKRYLDRLNCRVKLKSKALAHTHLRRMRGKWLG